MNILMPLALHPTAGLTNRDLQDKHALCFNLVICRCSTKKEIRVTIKFQILRHEIDYEII